MKSIKLSLIFISVALCGGCHFNNSGENHHEHDDEMTEITTYTSNFELFAQSSPFILNQTETLLAYITQLEDFKPLENANVNVSLTIDGQTTSQSEGIYKQTGIYGFSFQPTKAGNGTLIFDILTKNESHRITVPNVIIYENHEQAENNLEPTSEIANGIIFSKEQSWKIDFATDTPSTNAIGTVIKATGVIKPMPSSEVVLVAGTNGTVSMPNVLIPGSQVTKGTVLFEITGKAMVENNSNVRYATAKNNFELARATLSRHQKLEKDKIISEKELQESLLAYNNAEVIYQNLKNNFNTDGQVITTPKDGHIVELLVTNGAYVEPGTALTKISDNNQLLLSVDVSSKNAEAMRSFCKILIKPPHANDAITLEEVNGKLLSIGQNVNSANFLIPVNFQIDNKNQFVPGQLIEVMIETKADKPGISVPNSALVEERGNFFVLVQLTPELFEKRLVKTAESNGLRTVISSGITAEDRIVTKGTMMVNLAQSAGALDPHSGHAH